MNTTESNVTSFVPVLYAVTNVKENGIIRWVIVIIGCVSWREKLSCIKSNSNIKVRLHQSANMAGL